MINLKDLHFDNFSVVSGNSALLDTNKHYKNGTISVIAQISKGILIPNGYRVFLTVTDKSKHRTVTQSQEFNGKLQPIEWEKEDIKSGVAPTPINKHYIPFVKESIRLYREIFQNLQARVS